MRWARAGLVANSTSQGIPPSRHRAWLAGPHVGRTLAMSYPALSPLAARRNTHQAVSSVAATSEALTVMSTVTRT